MNYFETRTLKLPAWIEGLIAEELDKLGYQLADTRLIAECILRQSDFYIDNPDSSTPWHEPWCKVAQLAYYLPLNFLRNRAVLFESMPFHFMSRFNKVHEFGAGLGAATLNIKSFDFEDFEIEEQAAWPKKILQTWLSRSNEFLSEAKFDSNLIESVQGFREQLQKSQYRHEPKSAPPMEFPDISLAQKESITSKGVLGVFSYSLTELEKIPRWAEMCQGLWIMEPSTQSDGRKLLETRKTLMELGFTPVAPCTHAQGCPMLEKSPRDWCHDRIHIEMPDWFMALENHLPFRNRTLTFSYLLMLKDHQPLPGTRTVGDSLPEKGRTRQMICRQNEREFLTWLDRHGPAPIFPRGIRL